MSDEKNQLALLIPASAKNAHAELLAALGTESNSAQWIVFMETVTRLLPDVLSTGRPTKEAIQRSPIGLLGFSSWQEMIETPADQNGLGWNFSAWKAWRRAWSVAETHKWIQETDMTSSEVNTLSAEVRKSETEFPKSIEEFELWKENRENEMEKRKAESIRSLTEKAEAAERAATEAKTALSIITDQANQLRQQLETATKKIEEQAEALGTLKTQKSAAERSRDSWKMKAENPVPAPALTRLEHLKKALGLG